MRAGRNRAWYLSPYFQLGLSAVALSAAEVFLKTGTGTNSGGNAATALLNFSALASISTWVGISLYVFSFLIWLHVLRLMPLTEAYALSGVVHILVPTAAWLFLHESISVNRGLGILLVFCGTLLVAAPSARAEDKL